MPRLVLVRHCRTLWNEIGRYQGISDIELSPSGLQEAAALGGLLCEQDFNAAFCSDLRRAVQTAQAIVGDRHMELVQCAELRELDFGDYEGLTFAEIKQRNPGSQWWTARDGNIALPGGESISQLAARVGQFLKCLEGRSLDESLLIVTHGGTIRALVCHLLGLGLEHWWKLVIDSGSVTTIDMHPEGNLLVHLNEVCHLNHLNFPFCR